ncbi:hypothetical protein [Vibrio alginolyticus]|uniref:hypothetical protein n=1 Tax=Vibrio alginolyticus TaxID=663 RepID=UPI002FF1CBD6
MNMSVSCNNCGFGLPAERASDPVDHPCPECGSKVINIGVSIEEEVGLSIHDNVRARVKDDSYPSKDKVRLDVFQGADERKRDGKMMEKTRIIDKDNDHYKEVVTDPETDTVVHQCEEPLSAHRGHGSAKKKSK